MRQCRFGVTDNALQIKRLMYPSILVVHEIRLNKLQIGRTVTSVKQDQISNAM